MRCCAWEPSRWSCPSPSRRPIAWRSPGGSAYPADIEATLLRHPAVVEAAAFPVIVDAYRQIPVAAVVLRSTVSAEDLVAFCRQQLGARAPRRIHLFASLPKTATGKVLKRELARLLSANP